MNYHLSLINNVWAGKDQYISQDVEQTNCLLEWAMKSVWDFEATLASEMYKEIYFGKFWFAHKFPKLYV